VNVSSRSLKTVNLIEFLIVFRSTFHVADRLWNVPEAQVQKVRLFTEHKHRSVQVNGMLIELREDAYIARIKAQIYLVSGEVVATLHL